jgi:ribonuclease HI
MKTLKFDHAIAEAIAHGDVTTTWRLDDDKNLSVNDEVRLIDKVDPARPETWKAFGTAKLTRIIEKRVSDVHPDELHGLETVKNSDDLITSLRSISNNNVQKSTRIKLIDFTLSLLDSDNDVEDTSANFEDITAVKVYADGGSRGNPGPSASGYVIINPSTNVVLVDRGVYIGVTTNNQAEYLALKYALEDAQKMGVRTVDAYMDSLLVVNQLKGTFKVRNRDLYPIHDAVETLISSFEKFSITHVPRELNKLADAAVNRAMDEALGIERQSNQPADADN